MHSSRKALGLNIDQVRRGRLGAHGFAAHSGYGWLDQKERWKVLSTKKGTKVVQVGFGAEDYYYLLRSISTDSTGRPGIYTRAWGSSSTGPPFPFIFCTEKRRNTLTRRSFHASSSRPSPPC